VFACRNARRHSRSPSESGHDCCGAAKWQHLEADALLIEFTPWHRLVAGSGAGREVQQNS
jgi:hypothetical protein